VDATVWIDYLGGVTTAQTEWLAREMSLQPLGLTDLILCEVLQGIRDNSAFVRVRQDLGQFVLFETGGEDLVVASAQNYRTLRSLGFTVRKTIDCLIATFCLIEGHSLLHRDHDFDVFEERLGLSIVRPRINGSLRAS
jgi:predicted nucleic acid-binding protein